MKLVLFAWCSSGAVYLEAARAAGVLPELVVTGGSAPDEVWNACESLGVPLARCTDVNASGFIHRLERIGADLLFVSGCAEILKSRLLRVFRVAINAHPSLLPIHRGRQPLFWTILRGEARSGITFHHITERLDGGPIIAQREVAVPEGATAASLGAAIDREGAAMLPELFAQVREGKVPHGDEQQDGPRDPEPRRDLGLLDFTREAKAIDRLVRACDGSFPAFTHLRGMRVIILEGWPDPNDLPGARPGEVRLDDAANELAIATPGGTYRVKKIGFLGRVYDARALGSEVSIGPGDRFAANPAMD